MSDNKKERVMSVKGWLRKAETSKLSASAFLAAHRQWLETGELAEVVSPILRMHDDEKVGLLALRADTEAPAVKYLDLVKDAVLSHHLQAEVSKAERRLAEGESTPSTTKNWVAIVYNSKGEVQTRMAESGKVVDLEESFDLASAADRWADRRLFEGSADWYAVISHAKIMRADGDPISTVILRDDAIARILKRPKSPMTKKTGGGDSKLSFGVKAKQSHAHFSRG